MIFSFSRLSLYKTCPYRFYKNTFKDMRNHNISSLALGKGVHKAIEDKINGINHSEAILNGMIEADFYLPLSDETLASMIEGYIVLQHRI